MKTLYYVASRTWSIGDFYERDLHVFTKNESLMKEFIKQEKTLFNVEYKIYEIYSDNIVTLFNDAYKLHALDLKKECELEVMDECDDSVIASDDMLEEFMMPWAVGLLVLLLVVIGGISFELQSLKHLTNDIAMRKADDLTPISDKNIPLEISPLTQALNNLLERVNSVLQRERRFISDAAHELRTPLTALKVQLDVARISMDDSAVHKAALNKLDEGIERSIRLVEQLLSLSRVEASFQKNQKIYEVINWKLICEQMLNEYQSDISAKKLVIKITGNGAGAFDKGNSSLAELIVRNLLDNAIKYSPQGADIEIVIGLNYLEVRNTGVNIAPQDLNKLGERFFRIAGQNEKGNGIGLSIVKFIADFYACNLIFTNIENVFCARIEKK